MTAARAYQLDTDAAKEANSGGKRIKESGAYAGKIRAAWYETNPKGTEIVNILFNADNGQEAGPLALYTHKGDGTALSGYNVLNAIMTCAKVRALTPKSGPVELYDYDQQRNVTKDKLTYPELTGKSIGLVLRREEYENRNGELKERLTVFASFEPGTKLMAEEILSKQTEAKAFARVVEWIEREPVKHLKRSNGGGRPANGAPPADDFSDDDIPF